jgi:hypothetical protein
MTRDAFVITMSSSSAMMIPLFQISPDLNPFARDVSRVFFAPLFCTPLWPVSIVTY